MQFLSVFTYVKRIANFWRKMLVSVEVKYVSRDLYIFYSPLGEL